MEKRLIDLMFALVRYEVLTGEALSEEDCAFLLDNLAPLHKLSHAHDIEHIIASALYKLGVLGDDEVSRKFKKQQMIALYRWESINYELLQISEVFESAKIPFVLLKGAIIRSLYPEPWMRTSCDIDILVKEEDLERAVLTLKERLAYTSDDDRAYHDISLFSANGVHLELHFSIKENIESIDGLLSKVWDHTVLADETEYKYCQTNEYLIFHHIAHMSYHFVSGGCGIKPFLDLYLMKMNIKFDSEKVRSFCSECKLEKFYDRVTELSNVWFECQNHRDITLKMQSYILQGGVYGSAKNGIAINQGKKGGKIKYALSRIFLRPEVLENYYPCIKKHVWLIPFCEVHRWFKIILRGRFKRSVNELKINNSVSKESATEMTSFLNEMGL